MIELSDWLSLALQDHHLTQHKLSGHASIGAATVNGTFSKGSIPKAETLFRLADYLGVSRGRILRLAGHLPPSLAGSRDPAGGEVATLLLASSSPYAATSLANGNPSSSNTSSTSASSPTSTPSHRPPPPHPPPLEAINDPSNSHPPRPDFSSQFTSDRLAGHRPVTSEPSVIQDWEV